uniref:Uncharacterized protein n=1 Tax=Leptocylindrus danicus TaxID=163516 RepID=A0A7S2KTW4_9STRA
MKASLLKSPSTKDGDPSPQPTYKFENIDADRRAPGHIMLYTLQFFLVSNTCLKVSPESETFSNTMNFYLLIRSLYPLRHFLPSLFDICLWSMYIKNRYAVVQRM